MKIKKKAIYMVLAVLCINLTAFAQNINLKLNNVTVKKAMETLKEGNGYSFVFASGDVDTQKVIQVDVQNGTVDQVIKQILHGQKVSYEIKNKNIIIQKDLLSNQSKTEKKKITGTVTDPDGLPVIGANIVEKGTTNGIITDIDGRFQLETATNAILVISYIGYNTQEVKTDNNSIINIELQEDSQKLEEVVVVGYGVQQKANLSGAVAQLDSKELSNRPITNISSGIQGLMPGVTVSTSEGRPGQDNGSIRIRGVGTLNSSDPYVLIDGIESGSMNSIDPNDIESITVLKDASSAAIYGSKASNGVILITTKRGKTGKPQISYNGYVGIQNPTAMIDLLSSADYATLYNQALVAEGKNPRFDEKEIQKFRDGSEPYKYPNTDWQDLAFRTGVQHQHNVNVSGGTDNIKYLASVGYLNQSGVLRNSSRNQFNARTNLDIKLSERLNVRMNMSYFNNTYSDPNSCTIPGSSDLLIREVNIVAPWIPYKNEDGTYGSTSDGNPIAWLDIDQTVDNNIPDYRWT